MKTKVPIGFALKRIATEQFAIVEDGYSEKANTNLVTNLRFAINKENRMVAVFALFKFEQKKNPFLLIESSCHFQITMESWTGFISSQSTKIIIPKGFLGHLTMLTVGTTRGALHTKTEGTRFNQFILPTININDMVKKDISFE